jgi:hypothetical protein
MNPLARSWLRRIALGLPLVSVVPLHGCAPCAGIDLTAEQSFTITEEQRAMIAGEVGVADGGAGTCEELCRTLDPRVAIVHACEIDDAGEDIVLHCSVEGICRGGRRPAGLLAAAGAEWRGPVGEYLARCAHLEAASVPAFTDLAHELALHGAPGALVTGAQRAAADEVRHAREVAALARRFGARPPAVTRAASAPRTVTAIAEDNAVEGCAREAYAALIAAHQAVSSRDGEVAGLYSRIARDEARHALFSFALHDWALAALPARERQAIDERRRESVAALSREVEHEAAPALRSALGLPDAERGVSLAAALC